MSERHVHQVNVGMRLRDPQLESLRLLSRITDSLDLAKGPDLVAALETVMATEGLRPGFSSFEREFPSVCFALATGVGKTRLMGAFMAYLLKARSIRHYLVLAPNLTIYQKLKADLTPGTPKYVFQGVPELAVNLPELVFGDEFDPSRAASLFRGEAPIQVNLFNIAKITGETGRQIKKLSEYIGESYFEYLAGLPDLVLLMDEAHRYRASAGMKALDELSPVLGIELTATPKRNNVAFKNVAYFYGLGQAMDDKLVKIPAVTTRAGVDTTGLGDEEIDRIKIKDGLHVHELTKVELETFALERGLPLVRPFVLIVARTTEHASWVKRYVESDEFEDGRYRGRVIEIHSNQSGELKDEMTQKLLEVEDPNSPTEVVVHVNKLGEGWDVTNLYTIVPLRAAASEILTEQTIGRGLRLPYGRRMDYKPVDRLFIVAHDRFKEVIDKAREPDSFIKEGLVIGQDVPKERMEAVVVVPTYEADLFGNDALGTGGVFDNPDSVSFAKLTLDVIRDFESLPRSVDLTRPEVQEKIVEAVTYRHLAGTMVLAGTESADIKQVVAETSKQFVRNIIDIPRITVNPKEGVTAWFEDFDMDCSAIHISPPDNELLLHYLNDHLQERLAAKPVGIGERTAQDVLVRHLVNRSEVSYQRDRSLLYKLAGQVMTHLRSYLPEEESVLDLVQYYQAQLSDLIWAQMRTRFQERVGETEILVSKGFDRLQHQMPQRRAGDSFRDLQENVSDQVTLRRTIFDGIKRGLYRQAKFDSQQELDFARCLEREPEGLKWFRPGPTQFHIWYSGGHRYRPDFVVETAENRLIVEVKRADEVQDVVVRSKQEAAVEWCQRASECALESGGKPWLYLLIPHDRVLPHYDLRHYIERYKKG